MDLIERLFHVSPDQGDGSLEAQIVVVSLLALFVVVRSIKLLRHRNQGVQK
jgi:hypothetical protein